MADGRESGWRRLVRWMTGWNVRRPAHEIHMSMVEGYHRDAFPPALALPLLAGALLTLLQVSGLAPRAQGGFWAWLAVLGLVTGASWSLHILYRRDGGRDQHPGRWATAFSAVAVLAGLVWGSGSWVLYHPAAPGSNVPITLILLGLTAAMVLVRAGLPAASLGFTLAALGPFALHLLLIHDKLHALLALLVLAYMGLMMRLAWRGHHNLLTLTQLGFDNLRLSQALQQRESYLRSLIDHTTDLMTVVDQEGRIQFQNQSSATLLGYLPEEMVGRRLTDFLEPDDRPVAGSLIRSLFRGGFEPSEAYSAELCWRRKDGHWLTMEAHGRPVHGEGLPGRAVINARDVTENRHAMAALKAAREEADLANRAKSRFLAMASHDLRQPLHALSLTVPQLHPFVAEGEGRQLLRTLEDSVAATSALLNMLLDISRLDAGTIQPEIRDFTVASLFSRLESRFAATADQKGLGLRLRPSPAVLRTDPVLLERVLQNLIANALRYTDRGRVVVACRRQGPVLWRLEVYDTGRGIPEDQLETIFEEFTQLDNPGRSQGQGLGLGLAIVRRTAALLDLSVTVCSRPDRGSRFTITVPAGAEALAEVDADDTESLDELAGAVVLYVEDDAAIRAATARLLEGWGCVVTVAADGAAALEALDRCLEPEAGTPPDLLLCDYRLEEGESGITVLGQLQARSGTAVPGILITGDTSPERLQEAHDSGHLLVHKPIRPGRLRTLLRRVLREQGDTASRQG